ncbi:MAG: hypothetical protein EPO63_00175 [Candidatus Nitrosotenuis sp.]|nr:MAG: hypothetical protein EPO63_00175 [Candidatus Nitrosotenuis sp.]
MDKKILGAIGAAIVIAMAVLVLLPNSPPNSPPEPIQTSHNEKLGIVINPPSNQVTLDQLKKVYHEASLTGIGRNNMYLFWNHIEPQKDEYNWKDTDILMSLNKQNGLAVTLYFSVVNGRITGPYPDWMGQPALGQTLEKNLVKTLDAILSRYDIIDHVIIGGELDSYFNDANGNVEQYKEFFNNVYAELKQKHPNVQFGNAFSLNNIVNKDLDHYVSDVNVGDFVAFTYLPVDRLNDISKTPEDAQKDLQKALDLVPDKKIGIFEISWSTSDFVHGSEQNQTKFISESYDFYRKNASKFEFFTWYRQYDRPEGTCGIEQNFPSPKITIGLGSGLGGNEYVKERLSKYTCNAGLIKTDGTQKSGWDEIKKQIQLSTNP